MCHFWGLALAAKTTAHNYRFTLRAAPYAPCGAHRKPSHYAQLTLPARKQLPDSLFVSTRGKASSDAITGFLVRSGGFFEGLRPG